MPIIQMTKNISISSQFTLVKDGQFIQLLLYITNNSIKHQLFIYTGFNVKTLTLFQTTQFSISTQFKCQNSSTSNNSVSHKYAV